MIPVYRPSLEGNEKRYVLDCLDSTWISSKGAYIERFEQSVADHAGAAHAVAVCNGTVALHLALVTLGIGPGDEVIVPTLTYVASVNTIVQAGARPVFVDSLRDSWQLDPEDVRRRITDRTRAIMVVHLYGHPADMGEIMEIARARGIFVIEDSAEAFGARIQGQHVGTFGDIGTFSFFGNKTITTGEGGMLITSDDTLAERARHFRGQGLAQHRVYWHDVVGYNYRMTNICAAIGVAQMERADALVKRKLALAGRYDELLRGVPVERHACAREGYLHSYWMYSVLVAPAIRDQVMVELANAGIETRPVFYPVHTMPMYSQRYERHAVAEELGWSGINLPSWPGLSDEEQGYIAETLASSVERLGAERR